MRRAMHNLPRDGSRSKYRATRSRITRRWGNPTARSEDYYGFWWDEGLVLFWAPQSWWCTVQINIITSLHHPTLLSPPLFILPLHYLMCHSFILFFFGWRENYFFGIENVSWVFESWPWIWYIPRFIKHLYRYLCFI